jgi:hypothetical protein
VADPTPSAFELALHYARTRPDADPVECPACKRDVLEPIFDWPPSGGPAPFVCPSCTHVEYSD